MKVKKITKRNIKEGAVDYCIYTDTDSTFFSSCPILEKRFPNANMSDEKFMTSKTLLIADEIQKFINGKYNIYAAKFHNVKEHNLFIKQELVAKSALWLAKKRYAQLIINEEGYTLPEPELNVTGLDVVRSNFPIAFRTFMSEFLYKILNGMTKEEGNEFLCSFKESIKLNDLFDILSPSSIKDIRKYESQQEHIFTFPKGTPAHVKAAITYNNILSKGNKKQYQPVTNGDKIKYGYLKKNPLNVETCGVRGHEDPKEILDFIKTYIDYDKIFEKVLGNKIQQFYDAMDWGKYIDNPSVTKFFSF